MKNNNFQRIGSPSNAHVGRDFEHKAQKYFADQGLELQFNFTLPVGISTRKKIRQFDLGSSTSPIIVECKSHRWTSGGNVPSAKMTVWNEAMYYFHLAPREYRKVLFVLRDYSEARNITLAEYYVHTYGHLVPEDVEIFEYDELSQKVIEVELTLSPNASIKIETQRGKSKLNKYEPLETFLKSLPKETNEITVSFKKIEELIGSPLPASAKSYKAWWANQTDTSNRPQAQAWESAGFKVESVHHGVNEWVLFQRK